MAFCLAAFGIFFFSTIFPQEAYSAQASVTVDISPQQAREAGAQWHIRYRTPGWDWDTWSWTWSNSNWSTYSGWMNSGGTWNRDFSWVPEIEVEIQFKNVTGCTKPANYIRMLDNGDSFSYTGTYQNCTTPTTTEATTTQETTTGATTTQETTTEATTTEVTTTQETTTTIPGTACIDISQIPLDTQIQAAPATIMFVIDDSGSMDWEILTNEADGLFHVGSDEFGYLFSGYSPGSDNLTNTGVGTLTGSNRARWKSQWSGYNRMYYNSKVTYAPWPDKANADRVSPRSNPQITTPTLNMNDTYTTITRTGVEVIVDNGGVGYQEPSGTWQNSGSPNSYLSGSRYTTTTNGSAVWTPSIPTAGSYDVYVWYNCYGQRDKMAIYAVTHASGTTSYDVNQRSGSGNPCGEWVLLGTHSFNQGTGGNIRVTRMGNGGDYGDSTNADAVKFVRSESGDIVVKNAHYYVWSSQQDRPYLVVLDGNGTSGSILYYRFGNREAESASSAALEGPTTAPDDIVPKNDDGSVRSYLQEIQNFTNWFSYYRRREFTAKNAVANVIVGLSGVRVGYYGINGSIRKAVRPVSLTMGTQFSDSTSALLVDLYGINSDGSTPLRSGLKTAGDYLSGTGSDPFNTSPYYSAALGGACQQSFAIVMTDGYWNGDTTFNIGNQDSGMGYPYQDIYSNTLADVAMKYYKTDLSSGTGGLQNLVPTHFPDLANWQHMVTYAVAFGLTGTMNPDDYDFYNSDPSLRTPITWLNPSTEGGATKIDDLWHATVNGRGEYLSAENPEELTSALLSLAQSIVSRIGSGASVSINGEEIHAGSTLFQSSYKSDNWTGEVKAYSINPSSGAVSSNYLWSAQGRLESQNWNTGRVIATYDGTTGIPFRYASLSSMQQSLLNQNQVNYLRGDDSLEADHGGSYRNRIYKLGDIVHSIPVYHKNFIFAGGNDGMLHGFNASTGQEVFAYVPNLVFPNLSHLTSPAYAHKFYVNNSSYIKDIGVKDLLVCGLGAGGKGYFCLDVTAPAANTESNVNGWVKWEYPKSGTSQSEIDDLGLSFSQAFIVNSNLGWVVVFGNGYNSINGQAALYILNAEDGSLIKKINVGGTCNGLSTPAVIDVNNDYKVDYVYAGDLIGNLWKFDLTGQTATNWDVAYKTGSTPKPLFRAKDTSGTGQAITTKPDVMLHCDKTKPGYLVLFGTGKYFGDSDFNNTQMETIYGIWDYGDDADDSEYLGEFDRGSAARLSNQPNTVSLLQQTEKFFGLDPGGSSTLELRVISNNTPQWKTVSDRNGTGDGGDPSNGETNHAGWYFDLPISKERVIRNVLIRDGKLIVISSIPKTSPCDAGGDSIFHEMDACSGGRLTKPQFDINNDGVIDDNDMFTITVNGETITVPPTGIKYTGMIYEPIVLWQGAWETKYFSTSRGEIIMLKEAAERRGINYWREID
jgi:type IV pilus assembly protein PilY1